MGRTFRDDSHAVRRTDHPHAGGENFSQEMRAFSTSGPSPRGWGERGLCARAGDSGRTIPTRVGRTQIAPSAFPSTADHPHAGGENFGAARFMVAAVGPSPRGWGERREFRGAIIQRRTIPTRVGRTEKAVHLVDSAEDHPHAGGENWRRLPTPSGSDGPSPRGWGEPGKPLC